MRNSKLTCLFGRAIFWDSMGGELRIRFPSCSPAAASCLAASSIVQQLSLPGCARWNLRIAQTSAGATVRHVDCNAMCGQTCGGKALITHHFRHPDPVASRSRRFIRFITVDLCQRPPRRVRMPRALSSSAIAPRLDARRNGCPRLLAAGSPHGGRRSARLPP